MVVLFLIFKGTSILPELAVPIYIPADSARGFPFLHFLANTCYFLPFDFIFLMFIFEREREREIQSTSGGEAERQKETQNLKQAAGSELSAQSPTWGSNSQTMT